MEKVQASPNYRDGKFQNRLPTPRIPDDKSGFRMMYDFLFRKAENSRPDKALPVIKTDLKQLEIKEDVLVWMGHSSLFIQAGGAKFLIDPVLVMASPVSFVNKPFAGTELYKPDDMPDIDYLLITHDHYDHLDYDTVKNLKGRIGKVICGLGVGEHFEYWGFKKDKIIELDWNDKTALREGFVIHAFPTRHFSGRGIAQDRTLWVSFMIETPSLNIFVSGDTGYDAHFAEIGKQFPEIDIAIMENGQYDEDWRYIHLLPDELVKSIKELNPKRSLTIHNSKYVLGKHSWKAPLENISNAAEKNSINLITPMIGEIVYLKDSAQVFGKWWEKSPLFAE
ncbi:MAG: MBL fold metallo-hydrolase [Leptospirales bacterium]|nr:MBL fold metallo-hydrolase [Leptospirales bacterium]